MFTAEVGNKAHLAERGGVIVSARIQNDAPRAFNLEDSAADARVLDLDGADGKGPRCGGVGRITLGVKGEITFRVHAAEKDRLAFEVVGDGLGGIGRAHKRKAEKQAGKNPTEINHRC
jgi:hypothetical protein